MIVFVALVWAQVVSAGEVFVEAESFTSKGGWTVIDGAAVKTASGLAMLGGASGAKDGVATTTVSIKDAGHYQLWVRYSSHPKWRGPFHVTALAGDRVLSDALFDTEFAGDRTKPEEVWRSFAVDLPEGEVTLKLSKHENLNASAAARQIDCLLLTMNEKLVPNHLHFGAQTFVRITLGDGNERPAYIHVFADHFHAPWYGHISLGRAGAVVGVTVPKAELLKSGESTAWCNITPTIYQDSGAMLHITARHAYTDYAERLCGTFEFATAPDEKSIVRTLKFDNKPGTVAIFMPPNLLSADNLALMKTDAEISEATGKLADSHAWPTHGKPLSKFPFFVSANINNSFTPPDEKVRAREQKTLDYFGFSEDHLRHIGGAWLMKDKSYCAPDLEKMQAKFQQAAEGFKSAGGKVQDIVFCELTDEPTGQALEFAAKDAAYLEAFRAWLKKLGKTPVDLLVKDWAAVKIVTREQRKDSPALYYFSQRFRTRALGDFMATQGAMAKQAYGGDFPVLANFSDGAVYGANFFIQGMDYFELLDSPDQNAIWGEDWSNGASSYQCASFNVDLMRAAARERGQRIAHHLVAHAGRKAWDIKLKATSEVARGVKIFNSFSYGPTWATHEGGPYWRSHVWQGKPETWTASAAITREIGAVEEMLLTAMPAPAEVALLYSTASDVWTVEETNAYGFDRMHTWMALSHSQMPVDIVSEQQAEHDALSNYRVCYLTGPNLTLAAAAKLKQWVKSGGTLWLTAGAAAFDEYNRPMHLLDDLLPATRSAVTSLQAFVASGRYLNTLTAKDEVEWAGVKVSVLAVKQSLEVKTGRRALAKFKDGSAAMVQGSAAKGQVICCGFLPALSYIKSALDDRAALQKKIDDKAALSADEQQAAVLLERSYNPWKFPAAVRDLILEPTREAKITAPIQCNHPLVDAVYMTHEKGIIIPLANYTLESIPKLALKIKVPQAVVKAESATHGEIAFKQITPTMVELSLPLDNNDFLKLTIP